ncbi:GNAT family N-acetyltransferase [Paenibacillus pini]|uniref:N-acetyltransferase domain-containing protein n=1 Tax=Paenibacillus pini JCM 16418 TaxID=1236976 RepID=W7YG75_9BACL|nr:GNAT family N-acetyltransferase [Paenibacillus pini]GAF07482.1 hypothetical protein JCM16418_1499 [Paenibacillus pini JCM 16418]
MDFRLELVPPQRKHVINALMQLYFYDFTRYLDIDVNEDGLYPEYPDIEDYWTSGLGKHVYLITHGSKPAGFALVDRLIADSEGDYYMTEFFIMNKYRRNGLGTWAAHTLFDRFQGRWKVTQVRSNTAAQAFWRRVIDSYTFGEYTENIVQENGNISQYFITSRQ